jgi:hypothetical protein
MTTIPIENSEGDDIYSFGFDSGLNRDIGTMSGSIASDPVEGGAQTNVITLGNSIINPDGSAEFKDVKIGGQSLQYVMTDFGDVHFGDGDDGDAIADGVLAIPGASLAGSTYTLSRDVTYKNLTIKTGIIIDEAGYRISVQDTTTFQGTGKIIRDGANGTAGSNASVGPNGAAGGAGALLADGYLKGSATSGSGGAGANPGGAATAGSNGSNTTNSLGSTAGTNGQTGGAGSNGAGGAGGTGGTTTSSNVRLAANWHLYVLLDVSSSGSTVKYNNTGTAGGGGGGGGGGGATSSPGGGGGGGGGNGGIVALYSKKIVADPGSMITANGGNGGNGGRGKGDGTVGSATVGNGGGGAGGNGGIIVLVYNEISENLTLQANAGVGGTGGGIINVHPETVNTADPQASSGSAGTIYRFQITS